MSLFSRTRNHFTITLNKVPEDNDRREPSAIDLQTFLAAGGLLAGILYGFAWISTARLLAPFNVSPEEIGITPSWVLMRLLLYLFIPAAAVVLVLLLVEAKRRFSRASFRLVVAAIALLFVVYVRFDFSWKHFSALGTALRILVHGAVVAFIILSVLWWDRRTTRYLTLASLAALLTLLLQFASYWQVAAEGADALSRGQPVFYVSILPVPVLSLEPVEVFQLSDSGGPKPIFSPCATLLGSANGFTVLLVGFTDETQFVWRMPTDQISLRKGCNPDVGVNGEMVGESLKEVAVRSTAK